MVSGGARGTTRGQTRPSLGKSSSGIAKKKSRAKKKSLLPPPREITLRPVSVPRGLAGSAEKLLAEVARLEKLPVGSRYRKQRLQVVNHALRLAIAAAKGGAVTSADEASLENLLDSLAL